MDLVEILLSFFISENSKNRSLVQNCFRQVAAQCSQEALEAIAEALDPESKDGPLDIEDEDDLPPEENEIESDQSEDESGSDQEMAEDDREEEADESEEESENEQEKALQFL